MRISAAGLRESHVHDVTITREAPNYAADGSIKMWDAGNGGLARSFAGHLKRLPCHGVFTGRAARCQRRP